MNIVYTTTASSSGGRGGSARSQDGLLDVDLAVPGEMGGPGGATNPEQLFAAGYAACFENAVVHVAQLRKLSIGQTRVTATVGMGQYDDGRFGIQVALAVAFDGVDQAAGRDLIVEADRLCPYSNAIRGNVEKTITWGETPIDTPA